MLKKVGLNLQMCELDTFVTGILLCYYFLTGNELSVAEFWERNEESMQKGAGCPGRDDEESVSVPGKRKGWITQSL